MQCCCAHHQCKNIYFACYNEYFEFDGTSKRLQFCEEDSLICAKLKDITVDPAEFCKDFGYPVNENTGKYLDLDELQEDIINGEGFETVCFDSTPSLARF